MYLTSLPTQNKSAVNSSYAVNVIFSFQEGLKLSKALQEEKQEERAAVKLLDIKDKDEESGRKMKTSR